MGNLPLPGQEGSTWGLQSHTGETTQEETGKQAFLKQNASATSVLAPPGWQDSHAGEVRLGRMKQSRGSVRSCDQPDRSPPALSCSLKPGTSPRSLIPSLGESVTGFRGRGIQGPCLGWLSQPALPAGYPRRSRGAGSGGRSRVGPTTSPIWIFLQETVWGLGSPTQQNEDRWS